MCKSRAQEPGPSASSTHDSSSIQGPRGKKARKYNNKEVEAGGGVGKMDCHSLNKIGERGVRKIEKCRESEREE